MTILNSTRTAVGENRKAINPLSDALQTLDDKIDGEKDVLIKGILNWLLSSKLMHKWIGYWPL